MYQHYSNYLTKCRSNPYQRPSSNHSAAATAQAVAAQAAAAQAAAAQYASSVFGAYPGFPSSTGGLPSTEGTPSAAAAGALAAALYQPRPHSYDYSNTGAPASAGPGSLTGLPR